MTNSNFNYVFLVLVLLMSTQSEARRPFWRRGGFSPDYPKQAGMKQTQNRRCPRCGRWISPEGIHLESGAPPPQTPTPKVPNHNVGSESFQPRAESPSYTGNPSALYACKTTGPVPPKWTGGSADDTEYILNGKVVRSSSGKYLHTDIGLENFQYIDHFNFPYRFDGNYTSRLLIENNPTIQQLGRPSPNKYQRFANSGFVLTKGSGKFEFSGPPFFPKVALEGNFPSSEVGSIDFYGTLDVATQTRKPKVFSVGLSTFDLRPALTGNKSIDNHRALLRSIHEGRDEALKRRNRLEMDNFGGQLIFADRPDNPSCIIGATLAEPTNTFLIQKTGEYCFDGRKNGEQRFCPPTPKSDELRSMFAKSAYSHILAVIRDSDQLPCLSVEEAKKQLFSIPPGCGNGDREQLFE